MTTRFLYFPFFSLGLLTALLLVPLWADAGEPQASEKCLVRYVSRDLVPIPKRSVRTIEKSDEFHPKNQLFTHAGSHLRVKQVKYVPDEILGEKEILVSDLIALDTRTGKKLFDANSAHQLIFRDPQMQVSGGFSSLTSEMLTDNGRHYIAQVRSQQGSTLVYAVDALEEKVQLLTKFPGNSLGFDLSSNSRFLTVSRREGPGQLQHSVWDLEDSMRRLSFLAPDGEVTFSQTGDKVLITERQVNKHGNVVKKNGLYDLSGWKATDPTSYAKLKKRATIDGEIVAHSPDMRRLIVDEGLLKATDPDKAIPKLFLVDLSPASKTGTLTKTKSPLVGWDTVHQRLQKFTEAGGGIPMESVQAQLTPDGHYLAVRVSMQTENALEAPRQMTRVFKSDQDWVGVWDLKSKNGPTQLTSGAHFNTPTDMEPSPALLPLREPEAVWRRQFQMKLTPSGELYSARAVAHFVPGKKDQSTVVLKVVKANANDGSVSEPFTYVFGPMDISAKGGTYPQWQGIPRLEISPDGSKYGLSITRAGLRVLDLGK